MNTCKSLSQKLIYQIKMGPEEGDGYERTDIYIYINL